MHRSSDPRLEMMEISQVSLTQNCSNTSTDQQVSINLTVTSIAAACSVVLFVITVMLLVCKQSNTLLKRLFLYVMIAATLRELFLAASIEEHFKYKENVQEIVCSWIAYFYDMTGFTLGVFTVGLIIYLFRLVRCLTKGKATSTPNFLQSKYRKITLEIVYVILPFVIAFVYAIIPWIKHYYGKQSNAWCWIKLTNKGVADYKKTFTQLGLLYQITNGYLLFYIAGIIALILILAIAIIYGRLPSNLQDARRLLKQTLILLMCLSLRILVILAAFIDDIVADETSNQQLAVQMVISILYPVSLLFFPFGYLTSFYSGRIIQTFSAIKVKIKVCCYQCCGRSRHSNEYFTDSNTIQVPSFPASTRVSMPSHTYFSVPHTNEFTDLSTEVGDSRLLLVRGSQRCALSSYGSIS